MLKDFTEERDRVQKGRLVLRQDRFFACNRLIETLLKKSLSNVGLTFEVGLNAAKDDVPQLDSADLGEH